MISILNVEPADYSPEARNILLRFARVTELPLGREELIRQVADYDVLIARLAHQIDREVINAGGRLKAIVSGTTGLDHIDVEHAASRNISILSLKGETKFLSQIHATAEHTWALLLALIRNIPAACGSVQANQWDRDRFKGYELSGRRLGIVGLGRIGRKVAGYGAAFGMSVMAYDPFLSGWPERISRAASLSEMLAGSDVLSIHVPLGATTTRIIGPAELALLPEGAILINTARGGLVDEDALVDALMSRHLTGAALDVIVNERDGSLRCNSRLMHYCKTNTNLLITPHIGGATYESMHKVEVFMAQKLAQYFAEIQI